MVFGQIQTTLNFYFYGKRHFTQTGYEKNISEYEDKSFLDRIETLNDKVYAITGANSGIGKEMALYLAKKQAVVFMICRSKERAEKQEKQNEKLEEELRKDRVLKEGEKLKTLNINENNGKVTMKVNGEKLSEAQSKKYIKMLED